jgi:hypothetical protein
MEYKEAYIVQMEEAIKKDRANLQIANDIEKELELPRAELSGVNAILDVLTHRKNDLTLLIAKREGEIPEHSNEMTLAAADDMVAMMREKNAQAESEA